MRALLVVLSLLAPCATLGCHASRPGVAPVVSGPTAGGKAVDASAAWVALVRDLPGAWEATSESGRRIIVSYRLLSRGSVLVETFGSEPETQTLSAYHRDGSALMMTHYCGQGNQARLRVRELGEGRVIFTALDATNVSADQSVLSELAFEWTAASLVRTERYRANDGSVETTVLRFVRRDDAAYRRTPPNGA